MKSWNPLFFISLMLMFIGLASLFVWDVPAERGALRSNAC